jgi:type II secretory pathway component PulJ
MIAKRRPMAAAKHTGRSYRARRLAKVFGVASRIGGPGAPRKYVGGFTLAELLVSVFVLVVILLIVAQLMTNATAVTRTGNKHIDTDTQARTVFDRMALDFAQMVKRTDVDYYVKQRTGYRGHGNGHGWGQGHNGDKGSDQIAFFSHVPGYYPGSYGSPISLVAYRVNESTAANATAAYGRLERMAKGLLWNGVNNNVTGNNVYYPIVFSPGQLTACSGGNPCDPWASAWSAAINNDNNSRDDDYEVIAPGVFRFEYYYLLKNGRVTDWPWDRTDSQFQNPDQQTITTPRQIGLSQVEAIAVAIAVIDPAGRALIQQAASGNTSYGDILDVAADMADFKNANGRGVGGQKIGDLEAGWNTTVQSIAQNGQTPSGKLIPREAAKTIRIYNRYFDLKNL